MGDEREAAFAELLGELDGEELDGHSGQVDLGEVSRERERAFLPAPPPPSHN